MSRRSHRWRGPQPGSRSPAARPASQQRPRPESPLPPILAPRAQPAETAPSGRGEHADPVERIASDDRRASDGPLEADAAEARAVESLGIEPPQADPRHPELGAAVASPLLEAGDAEVDVGDAILGPPKTVTASPGPSTLPAAAGSPASAPRPGVVEAGTTSAGPSPSISWSDGGRRLSGPAPPIGPIPDLESAEARAGCTAAQLRRFIKSRAYVPLHELRRRFELDGEEDDVSPIDLEGRRLFIGLPAREASLLEELLRSGDVGYELLLDPSSPLVVGVFPMRPVPRA